MWMWLWTLFHLATLVATLILLHHQIRPHRDAIDMNQTLFDYVEYSHWIMAGVTALTVLLMMGQGIHYVVNRPSTDFDYSQRILERRWNAVHDRMRKKRAQS